MNERENEPLWHRDEPDSPCVNICAIHPKAQICIGCLRRAQEIAAWSVMSAKERRAILDALPSRKPMLSVRRGGRPKS